MTFTNWQRRGAAVGASLVLAAAAIVAATPAHADPGTSPDCVAQYVSDIHAADVQTVGQIQGSLPDGQAHTLQPFGTLLQYQATADHADCPFIYQP